MRIDWSTLALQTVNVVVLVWLLSRFLFRPVSDIIAKRQAAARKLIDDASRERDAAHAECPLHGPICHPPPVPSGDHDDET
ncbi:hypothetical protein ACN4GS_22105, partial [Burkholderia pseudomallei]